MSHSNKKVGCEVKNEYLIARRNKKGWSQLQVARQAGISIRQYNRIENEGSTPNVKTAIKLANILETTVEELFS